MIKLGSLVRFSPDIKTGLIDCADTIGIVVQIDYMFYITIFGDRQDRYHVLWGNEKITYESARALIEFTNEEKD
ncbi:hypothetical protein EBU71_11400 [bacterium]|jgi:hypothetical protein|nr:hypothetical protein [Candidatus Elulimicrobium humile]